MRRTKAHLLVAIVVVVCSDSGLSGCSARGRTVLFLVRIIGEQRVLGKALVIKNRASLPEEGDEGAVFNAVLGHKLGRVALEFVAGFAVGWSGMH